MLKSLGDSLGGTNEMTSEKIETAGAGRTSDSPWRQVVPYQESIVAWLPGRSSFSKAVVIHTIAVTALAGLAYFSQRLSASLLAALLLSGLATLWEICGIIWGCSENKKLIARMPLDLGLTSGEAEAWADQKLKLIWRNKGTIFFGLAFGAPVIYLVLECIPGVIERDVLRYIIAGWLGWGGFWAGAATYHIIMSSWEFRGLATASKAPTLLKNAAAGISEVGQVAMRYLLVYIWAATWWILVALLFPSKPLWVLPVMTAYTVILGLVFFFVPQWPIHRLMFEYRRQNMAAILGDMDETYKRLKGSVDSASAASRLKQLTEFYGFVSKLPTWPFNLMLFRFLGTGLLPFLPWIAEYLVRLIRRLPL
jgi:hypothetical protein